LLFQRVQKREPIPFTAKLGEYKIGKSAGLVKTTRGISVFNNPTSVSSKGFIPHKI
jgi:hypothetical protein